MNAVDETTGRWTRTRIWIVAIALVIVTSGVFLLRNKMSEKGWYMVWEWSPAHWKVGFKRHSYVIPDRSMRMRVRQGSSFRFGPMILHMPPSTGEGGIAIGVDVKP